jgi:UDP-N-acetylmuramoyl-tripeptide--D-alanyl-D-alanine ligase
MFKEMTMRDLARIVQARNAGPDRELIRGVSIDSRTVHPGEVFFALKGENTDGHLHVGSARARGAVAAVVGKPQGNAGEILVHDPLFALGELGRDYRDRFNPVVIGITGTNGKTTVKNILTRLLRTKYRVRSTWKNYNSLIGLPLTLFRLDGTEDYLVLELGTNHPGEIARLRAISRPQIGIITNVGPGHLAGLGSVDGVRKEKMALLENLSGPGFGVAGDGVYADCPGADDRSATGPIIRFSLNDATDVRLTENGSHFYFRSREYITPLLGLGNVYNCVAALTAAVRIGLDPELLAAVLVQLAPEAGRMEPIRRGTLLLLNDTYNANPASMKTALDYVAGLKRRRVLVLGDMKELGLESVAQHQAIGAYARDRGDLVLTMGDESVHYQGRHFSEPDRLIDALMEDLTGHEVVLVKASRSLRFEKIVTEILRRI